MEENAVFSTRMIFKKVTELFKANINRMNDHENTLAMQSKGLTLFFLYNPTMEYTVYITTWYNMAYFKQVKVMHNLCRNIFATKIVCVQYVYVCCKLYVYVYEKKVTIIYCIFEYIS